MILIFPVSINIHITPIKNGQIENLCYFLTFLQVMVARFGIAKQTLLIMILFFRFLF